MIKESQEKYLASLPDGVTIEVKPFDPSTKAVAEKILAEIKTALPDLPAHFGGAAALGIAGQNDIDILLLSTPTEFDRYRKTLDGLYGPPTRVTKSVKWQFSRDGFDVELYLTDKDSYAAKEQVAIFELLSNNKELLREYEQIKLPYGVIDFKEYMRKKYAFFNKILEGRKL